MTTRITYVRGELDAFPAGTEIEMRGFGFNSASLRKLRNGRWAYVNDSGNVTRDTYSSLQVLRIGVVIAHNVPEKK